MFVLPLALVALSLPSPTLLPSSSPVRTVLMAPMPARSLAPTASADDRARFDALMAYARRENLADRPLGEIAVALGLRLRGTPYVAGILDAPATETLVAPLDRFDCVLFVESVLALARAVQDGDATYEGYLARVEQQRYRGGTMDGYASRLHYFSDWVDDNAARRLAFDVTSDVGGVPYRPRLSYMTAHRSSYPHLTSDAAFDAIATVERRVSAAERAYVPKARVRAAYDRIQAGDVLATTTTVAGLDVTHVGFATVADDGTVGFLHASPGRGVVTAPDLAAYLAGNRAQTGVYVIRPN